MLNGWSVGRRPARGELFLVRTREPSRTQKQEGDLRKGLLQAGLGLWSEKGSEVREKLDGGDCSRFTQQVLELPHSLDTVLPKAQTHGKLTEGTGGPTASQAPSAGEASKLESSLCSPRCWFFLLPPAFHIHPQRVLVSCLGLQAWGMW